MIRSIASGDRVVDAQGFRVRGQEVSRVEALSDAVFGFAITLLVVSLDVPASFAELMALMSGFVAFGATFAQLLMIWYVHYNFFRRYGLQDFVTIVLNSVLLFVVVFYIYPLKFMFTLVFAGVLGIGSGPAPSVDATNGVALMVFYSLSVVVVYGTFVLMHWHAMRVRDTLGLDALEVHLTRTATRYCLIWVLVGLLSIAVAWFGGIRCVPYAGMVYGLLGPLQAWNGLRGGRLAPVRVE